MSNRKPHDTVHALRSEPIFERAPLVFIDPIEERGRKAREQIERDGGAVATFEPRGAPDMSHVGALAGEAVMKQAEAAAEHMVQAGLAAMALGNRIRDVADDLAEGLLARAKNLRGTIEAFSDTTLQLQALAAHQRTLLQNFDPPGPQVETTRQ